MGLISAMPQSTAPLNLHFASRCKGKQNFVNISTNPKKLSSSRVFPSSPPKSSLSEKVNSSSASSRHSGYFPWIHGKFNGKFICKGEGKWSCPGLRSYRSYGSEAMGWPYEQARRPPHRFRSTPLVASLPMTKIAIA